MSSASRCPNQDELRLFLMGQVAESDVESLETHVAECQDCVAVLSQLQAGDPFESAIRGAAHRAMPVDPDADRLVARIVGSMDSRSQSLATTASGSSPPPTDLDLSWLSPPETDDELGRVGAFRVLRVIGQGGMGVVFEAEDLKLQRCLALKVMLPKAAADPAGAARFLREARASAKVRHPNVVTIYQAESFGTVPFIAMELLRGESLHERLRRVGQLPLKDVLNLGRQIALGLAAAHTQGLLHRDIKPANIWLEQTEDGDVIAKVLDFGLARSVDSDGSLTQSGMIVGTPQYMAPEQARGATPSIRSDLFSLGCVLYQMTTGRQPFVGRNVLDQLRALAVDVPPQVSELRDNAPSELSQLIHQLLEKVPSSRPASATEVAERLREIATPQVQPPQVNHSSWQRWTLVAIAVTVVLSVAGIALRENRPTGDVTRSTPPASVTAQPLVAKPVASASTPQDNPTVNSVDLQASKPKFDALTTEGVQVLSDGTKPGDEWADIGLRMKFCWCPPGTFTMGSPLNEPARRPDESQVAVTLTSGFWIGKYEVTEREWQTIIEQVSQALPNIGKRNDGGTVPSFPKSDLNYDEAIEFCRRLTERERRNGHLPIEWEYQLPTEAQWEYACRAGTKTATSFGDGMGSHQANCRGDAAYNGPIGPSLQRVAEVGSYKPNTWGIHDMHGNVWEWCRDAYSEKYPGGRDPEVSTPASYRVGRGGGFDSFAGYCRSAIRFRMKPDSHSFGFRVAIVRRQPLVAKPETLDSAPRGMNERDRIKAADGKRHDVQLFWTGNEKQENISVKTAFFDGREPTTILNFPKKWGLNDFADITIDENTRRIYLGLPREENRDARIVSFDYDGHQLREELQSNFVWSMCVDESRQRLYVSGAGPSGIFSVPLSGNGTDRHQFTIPKTFYANGLTVDPIEQKVYWVDPGPGVRTGGRLQRSNLAGTIVENVMTGLLEPTGLALDPIEKTIYWVEGYPPRVRSVSYDGSNAKTLVAGESKNREDNYWDIAFDKPSGKLYFISRAAISRCDRDGSNLERLFAPGGDCLKITRGTSSPEPSSTAEKPGTEKAMPVEASKIQLDSDQAISRSVPRKWREVQSIDKDDGTLGAVVYGIALSPDGKLLATGDAGQVLRLWDVDTGKIRREIRNPLPAASEAMSPVFLKDGKRFVFVFARHHVAELWGIDSDKPLSVFQKDPNTHVTSMASINLNEDLLVTAGENGIVTLWSVPTAKPIRRIEHGLSGWPFVAISTDGKRVSCGTPDSEVVSICDCSTGKRVGTLSGHSGNIVAIATGRVGNFMATAGRDGTIRIWSASSDKQLRQVVVERAAIKSLALSPDERLIAAGLADGSVAIWDSETGRQVDVLKTNLTHMNFVTFSFDGRRLAANGDRSHFRIWQTDF